MSPLDGPAAFADVDKLSFLSDVIQTSQCRHGGDAEPSAIMVHTAGDPAFEKWLAKMPNDLLKWDDEIYVIEQMLP